MDYFIIFISIFFIILGILVWKYPNLIAGYNTMTQEQKNKVNIKALKSFMCSTFCAIGLLIFITFLIAQTVTDKKTAIILSSILIPILGTFYILIGAQRYDHNK